MNSLYGSFRNVKFTDVWDSAEKFLADYNDSALPLTITDQHLLTLFYLLYAEYGNSVIASSDVNQFRYKVFSLIYTEAPVWEKEMEIRDSLIGLSVEELQTGGSSISQHGFNPSTPVSSEDEIQTVDDQNKIKYKRSKLDAYANLMTLLKKDVTKHFIQKFKKLFLTVVMPEKPLWYVTENLEEGEEI